VRPLPRSESHRVLLRQALVLRETVSVHLHRRRTGPSGPPQPAPARRSCCRPVAACGLMGHLARSLTPAPESAMRSLSFLLLFVPASLLASVGTQEPPAREPVVAANGMIVCVSPPAADVGVAILQKGGNAVDAAVAVAFAEAVTWPEAGNIGGGGVMMVAPPRQEPACIGYRETAPAAATKDMFADGKIGPHDHKVAGVPGTVRGLGLAHWKFGKLPWKDVVMPAVKLAEDGFPVNAPLAGRLNAVLADSRTTNAEFKRVYGKPGCG